MDRVRVKLPTVGFLYQPTELLTLKSIPTTEPK